VVGVIDRFLLSWPFAESGASSVECHASLAGVEAGGTCGEFEGERS